MSDGGDLSVPDGHIGGIGGVSAAVIELTAAKEQIKHIISLPFHIIPPAAQKSSVDNS